jgi:hypothetical protein
MDESRSRLKECSSLFMTLKAEALNIEEPQRDSAIHFDFAIGLTYLIGNTSGGKGS